MKIPVALTIAGSDPSGGAGIQADLKTFAAHRVYGVSAITALTVQNTQGVQEVFPVEPYQVRAQILHLLADIPVQAVKLGMLGVTAVIQTVAEVLDGNIPLVLDPVMLSSSGKPLLERSGIEIMVRQLFPKALLVTPNLAEAGVLAGRSVTNREEMFQAARTIAGLGPKAVLVKGGHLSGEAEDILYYQKDYMTFSSERQTNPNTHGTGCTYASAIAANLALGLPLAESIGRAKTYITGAIAAGLEIGKGPGPTNHFFRMYGDEQKSEVTGQNPEFL